MYYLLMAMGYAVTLAAANTFIPFVTSVDIIALVKAALALTLLGVLLRPFLLLVLLPLNLITLGLFSVLINTWMVLLADKIVAGFSIGGFLNALITALVGMAVMHLLRSSYHSTPLN